MSGQSFGTLNETIPKTGGFLIWEQEYDYSRGVYQLEAGASVAAGQVVGVVTVSGEVKARDAAAGDGSEVAFGIARQAVDNTAGVTPVDIVLFDSDCLVNELMVTYDTGVVPADIASSKTELLARGIKGRTGPTRTEVFPL